MYQETEYKNKWQKEHTERIIVQVPIGQKDIIRQIAKSKGMSINKFVIEAIEKAIG